MAPDALMVRGIVQPGPWPAEPTVTPSEPAIKGVAQRDLQVADGLPERGGDGRVPAIHLDRRREVPFAVSEISAQPLGAEEVLEVRWGELLRRAGHRRSCALP